MKVTCINCRHVEEISSGWDSYKCPACSLTMPVAAAETNTKFWAAMETVDEKGRGLNTLKTYYRQLSDSIAALPYERDLKNALLLFLSNAYAVVLNMTGNYDAAKKALQPCFYASSIESNPFVPKETAIQAMETLAGSCAGLLEYGTVTNITRRVLYLKAMLYKEKDPGAQKQLELRLQSAGLDIDEGHFERAEDTLRTGLSLIIHAHDLDRDEAELMTLLYNMTLGRCLVRHYEKDGTAKHLDEALPLLEPLLPRLEELCRKGASGLTINYIMTEGLYGTALVHKGQKREGKKLIKSSQKRMKLYRKGKPVF